MKRMMIVIGALMPAMLYGSGSQESRFERCLQEVDYSVIRACSNRLQSKNRAAQSSWRSCEKKAWVDYHNKLNRIKKAHKLDKELCRGLTIDSRVEDCMFDFSVRKEMEEDFAGNSYNRRVDQCDRSYKRSLRSNYFGYKQCVEGNCKS